MITAIDTAQTGTQTGKPADAKAETSESKLSSDFETFLQMLTVQMENQDPLNPIASEDFAVQLATFSGVEQQVRTNDLLQGMTAAFAQSGVAGVADWIGKEARVEGALRVDGSTHSLQTDVPATATRSELVVRQGDRDVARIDLGRSDGAFTWSGRDARGSALLPGDYSVAIEHFSGTASLGETPAVSYARITEARIEGGETRLITASGQVLGTDQITGLRAN